MGMRIAVVIPCRDDAVMLTDCLRALSQQQRPADRIIVVDNASSDGSAAIAAAAGADVVFEGRIGIWPAAAAGYDAAAAGADIIARVDADSRPHPDWLLRIEKAFAADADLGVLTGGAEFYGSTRLVHYLGERWYIGGGRFWVNAWLGIPLVFGSNFAMRTGVWARVRDQVRRDDPRVHDDLDLTIHLRRDDGVRWDRRLRMPVSSRPLVHPRGLALRLGKVLTTFAASWPRGRFRAAVRPPAPSRRHLGKGADANGSGPTLG